MIQAYIFWNTVVVGKLSNWIVGCTRSDHPSPHVSIITVWPDDGDVLEVRFLYGQSAVDVL